jgi:GNAT superfamily N-acetyltransferase
VNQETFTEDESMGSPRDRCAGRGFTIRPARLDDCETIANLVRELAVYEKLERFARATAEDFRANLFGPRPFAEAIMAEVDGEPVGMALGFPTFRGQPGFYLEDIYVRPEHRGKGIGKALLATIAELALRRGFGRVEWSVLDWNTPAIGFYRALGARPMDEWTVYRVDDGPLERLAAQASVAWGDDSRAVRPYTVLPGGDGQDGRGEAGRSQGDRDREVPLPDVDRRELKETGPLGEPGAIPARPERRPPGGGA